MENGCLRNSAVSLCYLYFTVLIYLNKFKKTFLEFPMMLISISTLLFQKQVLCQKNVATDNIFQCNGVFTAEVCPDASIKQISQS